LKEKMQWPRIVVALVAVLAVAITVLVWLRAGMHHESTTPPKENPISDRSMTSPLNVPGGGAAPDNAYEVYSALYQSSDEPLVFSEDSVTDIPQVNGSCLRPTTEDEREMTDAFVAINQKSHRWQQRFAIPGGYEVIPRAEASLIQTCLDTHNHDASRCAQYKQVRHVRFLGVPGFNHTHTEALVSVVRMCGSFCGTGGIFEVEKTGTTWRRAEPSGFTRDCSWMY
jgi:hypothetical protein